MDDKIYTPEVIEDIPFPSDDAEIQIQESIQSGQTVTPAKTKDQNFPRRIIARETISSSLNTKSRKILATFEFTEMGALQIGKYQNGISGDIRISPSGILARNLAGELTFALDGESGDAVFKGTITTGAVISGEVVVGNNRLILTVTEDGQPQIILNDGQNDRILIGYGDF